MRHMDESRSNVQRRPAADGFGKLSDYPAALVHVTLGRVTASDTFRRSQRHRLFLEHVIHAGSPGSASASRK